MKTYTYRVIIEPDGKKYHGYVPALPGCHTCGKTIEETQKNLRDAISLYLEKLNTLMAKPRPFPSTATKIYQKEL